MTYFPIATVDTGCGKIYLGEPGRCRYCHKESPEVSFSKEAHAIPHLLGNNEIFSHDECNSCNKFFGDGYDDDLGKYLLARRVVSQIPGKKGIPSYKTKQELSRIDVKEEGIEIRNTEGDDIVQFNEGSNTVDLRTEVQPYSPLGVYSSFVKMAIAFAPQDILPRLDFTRQCLIQDDIYKCLPFTPFITETFIPGPGPMKNVISAMLLKRSEEMNMPSLIFGLSVSNYCFEIVVPCPDLDQNLAGQDITIPIPIISHPLKYGNPYGPPVSQKVDFSQKDKVKGQISTTTMGYNRKHEVGIEKPGEED